MGMMDDVTACQTDTGQKKLDICSQCFRRGHYILECIDKQNR